MGMFNFCFIVLITESSAPGCSFVHSQLTADFLITSRRALFVFRHRHAMPTCGLSHSLCGWVPG